MVAEVRFTDPDLLAERHLVHRMIVGTAVLIPAGAAFFALVVGIAASIAGVAMAPPIAMGAGIGALAGVFFGTWAGFVASVNEFEDLERAHNDGLAPTSR